MLLRQFFNDGVIFGGLEYMIIIGDLDEKRFFLTVPE